MIHLPDQSLNVIANPFKRQSIYNVMRKSANEFNSDNYILLATVVQIIIDRPYYVLEFVV